MCTVEGLIEDIELTPVQAHRHFKYPFVGKGSPEQAQIAIQLVYRYHKARSTPGQFVTQDFIGLDATVSSATTSSAWSSARAGKTPTTMQIRAPLR